MDRPAIPAEVALKLRQEAGFGCCKCGYPNYDYNHIIEYSVEPHYRPEDMLILCPNCHRQVTAGAMSVKEQRLYKKNPFNIKRGFADGQLKIEQSALVVSFGTVQFVRDGFLFKVDGEELASISLNEEGRLEVSPILYTKEDELLATIIKNEWMTGQRLPWDLQSGWRWLQLRNRKYDIAVEIDARMTPVQIRGDLWRKKQHFEITNMGIKFNGVIQNFQMRNLCLVGTYFSADTSGGLSIVPDERYGEGVLVSEGNAKERIRKGLKAWDDLVAGRPTGVAQWYTATKTPSGYMITAEDLAKFDRKRTSHITENEPV